VTFESLFNVRCEPRAGAVVVLRGVTFIDSSGLGVIVGQQKRSREDGHSFAIAVDGASPVQRILDLSGLINILDVVADPAERLT
jgi:anti-anti-sigma factor